MIHVKALVAVVVLLSVPVAARADTVVFSLAIGHNGAPATDDPGAALQPLHYADDDAAAFHQLARVLGRRSYLLAVLDADTQVRFPQLAAEARAPSLAALDEVVAELNGQLAAVTRGGHEPVVLVFYSGHGKRGDDGDASLTLLDGQLTQELLYARVLDALKARYVHLLVDACHAEAVVRPRDVQAAVVDTTAAEISEYLSHKTLARYPHVGAIVASTASAQAHEWDAYQSGVFTHEVLSGLRGAADVDGNGRIEYSELAAFLAAANRSVTDPRARLETVVRPPPLNPRAAIADLRQVRGAGRLRGEAAPLGVLSIESSRGARLLDLRAEPGFSVDLLVPAGELLHLRSRDREADVTIMPGEALDLGRVAFRPARVRPRDAMDSALRRGLFATGFGPAYYRGFVDRARDLVSVDLLLSETTAMDTAPPPRRRYDRWAGAAAGGLAVGSAIFTGLALDARGDYQQATFERDAQSARDRYDQHRILAVSLGVAALVGGAVALWLWRQDR